MTDQLWTSSAGVPGSSAEDSSAVSAEKQRLQERRRGENPWHLWGPYLSERQWGTVREDYSPNGEAWNYFPHDHARSRAYRWGEDGLGGICDEQCRLCVALALWNEHDPILKERLFGLTNGEGNHGEDVKELYYYLDALPSHAYLKMLYKYPQQAFPYDRLIRENHSRGRHEGEWELLDSGVFDDNRYFDVVIEYAKGSPTDLVLRVTAYNRGPMDAPLHLLPQLYFRNTWSWHQAPAPKPEMALRGYAVEASHPSLGTYRFQVAGPSNWLFCDNETNPERHHGRRTAGYFKDAIHAAVVAGQQHAVNPRCVGTKVAAHHRWVVPAGGSVVLRARLAADHLGDSADQPPLDERAVEALLTLRRQEADAFYAELQCGMEDEDARSVQRQALAGTIWSKQFYHYDVRQWLQGDPAHPAPPQERRQGRNREWGHLHNSEVISMPDKWEYPWYAAWDLAFHCLPLAMVDPEFAKRQLLLLTREWYMHPNGQIPAYEWALGDVNPPVQAWAAWRVFQMDRRQRGDAGDLRFLERVFHKLLLNFTWWVNRKDPQGRNIFQGGFLGLDNIGVFDRSAALPTGGHLNQADGTSWMAMYCLNLMRIALELALHNHAYEDIASKFFEHFLHIAEAMTNIGESGSGLWDESDQFFYDKLHLPDGQVVPLKVRSLVGLSPLFAVETLEPQMLERLPAFHGRLRWLLQHRPELAQLVSRWEEPGLGERRLLSLLRGSRMKRLLRRMLDETEFLSPHGIRGISRVHSHQPFTFPTSQGTLSVSYVPAESDSGLFGGNSNWRGPVWVPMNYLLIESLQKFHHYYGDEFRVECPTGSGSYTSILGVAEELSRRLTRLFLRDANGRRPVWGEHDRLQMDPHFRDHLLFFEYFHGDNGRGVGASHQTGWTALVAKLLQPRRPEAHCSHHWHYHRPGESCLGEN